jgi:steroid delta-isomerase-like uncharacterized protein
MSDVRNAVDRWWGMFESGRLDELSTMVRPDAQFTMPGGVRLNTAHELRPILEAYLAAFSDIRHEVVALVEGQSSAAVELKVTMTHTGTFNTPMGDVPASGNRVVIESCDVIRVDDQGLIASWHTYFDSAAFAAQLGVGAAA